MAHSPSRWSRAILINEHPLVLSLFCSLSFSLTREERVTAMPATILFGHPPNLRSLDSSMRRVNNASLSSFPPPLSLSLDIVVFLGKIDNRDRGACLSETEANYQFPYPRKMDRSMEATSIKIRSLREKWHNSCINGFNRFLFAYDKGFSVGSID